MWIGERIGDTASSQLKILVGFVFFSLLSSVAIGEENPVPPQVTAPLPVPENMTPLKIEGFEPALHAGPVNSVAEPWPVMIFLHGINADVTEQCGQWLEVGRSYGWLLCIRGTPQPGTTRAQNRWTHRNWNVTRHEIDAALEALEQQYPGRVSRENMVLAGYSRGAILAPKLVTVTPNRYRYLFLAEGGMDQLEKIKLRTLHSNGVQGIALAMGTGLRRKRAQRMVPKLLEVGLKAAYIDMPGAGHHIGKAFPTTGQEGLRKLLGDAP